MRESWGCERQRAPAAASHREVQGQAHSRLAGGQGRGGGAGEETRAVAGHAAPLGREAVQRIRQEVESEDPPPLKQSEQIQQLESKLEERDLELDFFARAFGKLGRPCAKG